MKKIPTKVKTVFKTDKNTSAKKKLKTFFFVVAKKIYPNGTLRRNSPLKCRNRKKSKTIYSNFLNSIYLICYLKLQKFCSHFEYDNSSDRNVFKS